MSLIWSESTQWLLTSSIRKVTRMLIMPLGMPMWPWWANDHDVAHLQAKMVPMNLNWVESTQWWLRSSIRKVTRVINTPVGKPMWPWWENDHDVAHLQIKTVPMTLIWNESTQRLLSSSICKVLRLIIMPMSMTIWPQWANDHDAAHIQAKTVPKNFIWSEPSSCGVTVPARCGRTDGRMDGQMEGQTLTIFIVPFIFLLKGRDNYCHIS